MKIVLALLVLLILPLCGCACLQDKPALRTALIATGAAVLGGAISHARDNDPQPTMKRIPVAPCHDKDDCR